jgi:hypothetical protein
MPGSRPCPGDRYRPTVLLATPGTAASKPAVIAAIKTSDTCTCPKADATTSRPLKPHLHGPDQTEMGHSRNTPEPWIADARVPQVVLRVLSLFCRVPQGLIQRQGRTITTYCRKRKSSWNWQLSTDRSFSRRCILIPVTDATDQPVSTKRE